ncbi:MAG: sulfate adenylyltransferase subunit CysD [Steroidobacteraceae bacterium]
MTGEPASAQWPRASLAALEAEAIYILREAIAEARNPVLLFSGGKDSTVLAHLACRAFHPSRPPVPLLHIDSTWEFREVLQFRDRFARRYNFDLRVSHNEAGRAAGINPFEHGDRYTTVMRTDALKSALDLGRYDVILGGARRDEERSRAKERVVSVRGPQHTWDPRRQRPELWSLFNFRLGMQETARVFPLSNWTELDVLAYALAYGVELAPLYFARPRWVLERDARLIVVDEPQRMRLGPGEILEERRVRFRTLGCWPVTAAEESDAETLAAVLEQTLRSPRSERSGRLGDRDAGGSLEQQKRDGYF